ETLKCTRQSRPSTTSSRGISDSTHLARPALAAHLQVNVTVEVPPLPTNWMETLGPGCGPVTPTICIAPGARLPLAGLGVTGGLLGPAADQFNVRPPVFLTVIGGYFPLAQKAVVEVVVAPSRGGGGDGVTVGCARGVSVGGGTGVSVGAGVTVATA